MGCGGSTAAQANPDADIKYAVTSKDTTNDDNKGKAANLKVIVSPTASDNTEKQLRAVAQVVPSNVHYACFKTRMPVKMQPEMQNYLDLYQLSRGIMGIERTNVLGESGAKESYRPIRIVPDFCSRFSLVVPESLAAKMMDSLRDIESGSPSGSSPTGTSPRQAGAVAAPTVSPAKTGRKKNKAQDRKRAEGSTNLAVALLLPKMVPLRLRDIRVRVVQGQSKSISSIALSSDEKMIAIAAVCMPDLAMRAAQLHSANERKLPEEERAKLAFQPCALGLNGNSAHFRKYETKPFLSSRQYSVRTFDVRLGRLAAVFTDKNPDLDPQVNDVFFGPENQHIYTSGITIDCWDVSKRRKTKSFEADGSFGLMLCSTLSSCGKYVAAGVDVQDDCVGWVGIWREQKLVQTFRDHTAPVSAVAFNADTSLIISADRSGEVILWDPHTLKWKCTFPRAHPTPVISVVFVGQSNVIMCDSFVMRKWSIESKESQTFKSQTTSKGSRAEYNSDSDSVSEATASDTGSESGGGAVKKVAKKKALRPKLLWTRNAGNEEVSTDTLLPEYPPPEQSSPRNSIKFRLMRITPGATLAVLQTYREVCIMKRYCVGEEGRGIWAMLQKTMSSANCW